MIDSVKSQNTAIEGLDNPKWVRVVRWYEKNGERLRGKSALPKPILAELQTLFSESKENLMYEAILVPLRRLLIFRQMRISQLIWPCTIIILNATRSESCDGAISSNEK